MNWDWLETKWAPWAAAAALMVLIAMAAWWGERRRQRRADPDAVGFVPWGTVFVLALFATLICTIMALHGGS